MRTKKRGVQCSGANFWQHLLNDLFLISMYPFFFLFNEKSLIQRQIYQFVQIKRLKPLFLLRRLYAYVVESLHIDVQREGKKRGFAEEVDLVLSINQHKLLH